MHPLMKNYYQNNHLRVIFWNFQGRLGTPKSPEKEDFFGLLHMKIVIFAKAINSDLFVRKLCFAERDFKNQA